MTASAEVSNCDAKGTSFAPTAAERLPQGDS